MGDGLTVVEMPSEVTTQHPTIEDQRNWSEMSLRHYLSQAIVLSSGNIGIANTGTILNTSLPTGAMNAQPLFKEKLRGFLGFRATTTLRLVINADKYTSGLLCMAWRPPTPTGTDTNYYLDHQRLTQLPHVLADVNTDTEVVLTMPYKGPASHYNLLNGLNPFGSVLLRPLVALQGSPISYTLFVEFSDVSLAYPTVSAGVVAQSNIVFQSNVEVEQEGRPISKMLGRISSAATTLASVPLLTSFAQPLAWATAIGSNVAYAFGYSRPSDTRQPAVTVQRKLPRIALVDGSDVIESLGYTTDARVKVDPSMSFTEQDEMSIKYLTQIKSSLHIQPWSLTDAKGAKLFTLKLGPTYMSGFASYTPNGSYWMHPIAYLANVFGMYRGSFEVELRFVKSLFHTGRLMVVFEPGSVVDGVGAQSSVTDLESAYNCHRDIVDMRAGNKFTFKFPYSSLEPYKHTYQPYGFMHIFVLNPLTRNEANVSANVNLFISVKGSDDWEFANPKEPIYWPYAPSIGTPSTKRSDDAYTLDTVVAQSGLELGGTVVASKAIGSSVMPTDSTRAAELCVGERIMSVKQLALVSKPVSTGTPNVSSDPFGVDFIHSALAPAALVKRYRDWFSYVGAMYNFNRGGVILTVHNKGSEPLAVYMDHGLSIAEPFVNSPSKLDLKHIGYVAGAETARLYIPPGNRGFCRHKYDSAFVYAGVYSLADCGISPVRIYFRTLGTNTIPDNVVVMRSAADDTQFGYFTGVPVMTTANTAPETYFTGQINTDTV